MPDANDNPLPLVDRTEPRPAAAAPPPLLSTSALLGTLLKEMEARYKTRQGGGWTGGLRCGFRLIDRELRGFRSSSVTVLNAEPTIGKSTLANQIAYQVAAFEGQQAAALYASFEDDPAHLLLKQLARLSGWTINDLESGDVAPSDPRLVAAIDRLARVPLFYLEGNAATSPEVLMDRWAEVNNLTGAREGLIVVDYLQFLARYASGRTQTDQVGVTLTGLAEVAHTTGAALFVIASQNRETNKNGAPTLYGGRSSGEIEYDADALLSMTRDDPAGPARTLTAVKTRFGGSGAVARLTFTTARGQFDEAPGC